MCTVLCPLCGIRQKRQRKLQLGCRRTCNDARLRGDDVVKSIVSLVGACLFIIGASIVFPAFFGYRI